MAYLITTDVCDVKEPGFIMIKSKVTVPRLELCAAVLAFDLAETITEQLNIQPNILKFHTDSKIVHMGGQINI